MEINKIINDKKINNKKIKWMDRHYIFEWIDKIKLKWYIKMNA